MMGLNTRQKREIARLKVLLRAAELGAVVSLPTTEVRYDMVVDWGGRLYRAQVKYGNGKPLNCSGAVTVSLVKGDKMVKRYQDTEIDVVLAYLPQVDTVCWFGPEIFHNRYALQIRLAPAKNNQKNCLGYESYIWQHRGIAQLG